MEETIDKMQHWSLDRKISYSIKVLTDFKQQTNKNMVVMFSGGKDSTVLLHLCRTIYPDIKAVFVNTTNEFTEIIKFVKRIENVDIIKPNKTFLHTVTKYGFPIISKKVSRAINTLKNPTSRNQNTRNLLLTGVNRKGKKGSSYKLANKWKFLIDAKFNLTYNCCDILKHKPAEKYHKQNNVNPILGTMATESETRRMNYIRFGNNILGDNPKSRPLSIWTEEDIWNYIDKYNVDYCPIYDDLKDKKGNVICKGEKRTGCAFCSFGLHLEKPDNLGMKRFDRLKIREPKRYIQQMELKNNGVTYKQAIDKILNQ